METNPQLPVSDVGTIRTPIGTIAVPGFAEWRALSDDELCTAMNGAAFVSPQGLAVATARPTVCHYYDGKRWLWNTMAKWQVWRDAGGAGNLILDQIMGKR